MDASWYPLLFFGAAAILAIIVIAVCEFSAYLNDPTHWID